MKTLLIIIALSIVSCTKINNNTIPDPTVPIEARSVYNLSGNVVWEHDDLTGCVGVLITLSGDDNQTTTTDVNGNYSFIVPAGNYVITPSKNSGMFNGANSIDANSIQLHLTGSNYITDFYKLVAADCNGSLSISSVDASLIRFGLNGNPSANNILNTTGSWKFIPTNYVHPVPVALYTLPAFPKFRSISVSSDLIGLNFYGIKTGDVNGTANPAI